MALGPEARDPLLADKLARAEEMIDRLIVESRAVTVSVPLEDTGLTLTEFTRHLQPKYHAAGWSDVEMTGDPTRYGGRPVIVFR